jgi:hypothetical protein
MDMPTEVTVAFSYLFENQAGLLSLPDPAEGSYTPNRLLLPIFSLDEGYHRFPLSATPTTILQNRTWFSKPALLSSLRSRLQ